MQNTSNCRSERRRCCTNKNTNISPRRKGQPHGTIAPSAVAPLSAPDKAVLFAVEEEWLSDKAKHCALHLVSSVAAGWLSARSAEF